MYSIDTSSGNIILPQGDTLLFHVRLSGTSYPEGTMAVFAVRSRARELLLRKQAPVADGEIVIYLANAETRALPVGKHKWDLRIVTDPELDEEGNLRAEDESDNVLSVFAGENGMPAFEVREVIVDV